MLVLCYLTDNSDISQNFDSEFNIEEYFALSISRSYFKTPKHSSFTALFFFYLSSLYR